MGICIYGSSDDLLEVTGDIREEFSHIDQDGRYVACSNGVVVKVTAGTDDDAAWIIRPIHDPHRLVTIEHARGEDADHDADGCPGYSDKAVIAEPPGGILWVVVGGPDSYQKAR